MVFYFSKVIQKNNSLIVTQRTTEIHRDPQRTTERVSAVLCGSPVLLSVSSSKID